MDGWTGLDWIGLDPLRSLVPLEHLAVLINIAKLDNDVIIIDLISIANLFYR